MKRPYDDPTWSDSVREVYRNDLREMWEPTLEPQTYRLYQNQLRLYRALAAESGARRILDVGCAQATLSLTLAEAGADVTAVDIRPEFLEYAKTRYEHGTVRFVQGNILDEPILGEFDLVYANQIIEHLLRPVEFIECLARYLRPGGRMVLTTPNQQYVRCGLPRFGQLGDVSRYRDREFSAGGADHFFAYTLDELRHAAENAGLRVREALFFESPWISGHMKVRFVQPWLPTGILERADRLTLSLAGRYLGHQMCVVAMRPAGA